MNPNLGMLYQKTQEQTTDLASFLNGYELKDSCLPSALSFWFSAIVPKCGKSKKIESIYKLSIRIKKRFEIVVAAIFSVNGRRRHG